MASDPGNADWQRDLAIDYLKIGNVMLAKGRYDDGARILLKKLAIDERLAAAAPNDLDAQSALAGELRQADRCHGQRRSPGRSARIRQESPGDYATAGLGRSHQYAMAAKSRL